MTSIVEEMITKYSIWVVISVMAVFTLLSSLKPGLSNFFDRLLNSHNKSAQAKQGQDKKIICRTSEAKLQKRPSRLLLVFRLCMFLIYIICMLSGLWMSVSALWDLTKVDAPATTGTIAVIGIYSASTVIMVLYILHPPKIILGYTDS